MSAELFQQCVNWLTLGSTYALVALGFSLLFGVLKIIHFSHGDVSLVAPFIALSIVQVLAVWTGGETGSLLAACMVAIVATGCVGVLLDWLVIRRFRNAPPMMALVATVALGIVLRELIRHLFPHGSNPHAFPQIVSGRIPLANGIEIPVFSLFTILTSIAVGGLLFYLLNGTWMGVRIRAVSQDREAARLMAIDPNRIFWITFFIASAIGAVGGLFQAGYAGVVRFDFSIQAGTHRIFGRRHRRARQHGRSCFGKPGDRRHRNLDHGTDAECVRLPTGGHFSCSYHSACLPAGRLFRHCCHREGIGMVDTLAMTRIVPRGIVGELLTIAAIQVGVVLLLRQFLIVDDWRVIVGILLVFGGALALLQIKPKFGDRLFDCFHRHAIPSVVLAIILALLVPFTLEDNTYAYHLLIIALLYSVLALALNFQLGSANIPNFATGASYGVGAYASAILAINFNWSFWLVLPAAAAAATLLGLVIGLPSMRTRDSYLALVTIAFGVVVHELLNNLDWTGGPNGLVGIPMPSLIGHSFASPIELFGFSLPSHANFYYLSLALLALAILFAQRLHDSRVGLAWNALRADELAARCQGINVTWYKVLAFAVDAFLAAFAGTIYAFYVSFISPDNFTFLVSVMIMTMVIVGGMDNILGVIVGAFLLTILPEKLRVFSDYRILLFGVTVILFLIVRPQGLFPQRLRRYGDSR